MTAETLAHCVVVAVVMFAIYASATAMRRR